MGRYIFYLAVLFLSVAAGAIIFQDPGYALFAYGQWTVEMPLWLALLSLVLFTFVVFFFLRLIVSIINIPSMIRHWNTRRKQRKYHELFFGALNYLILGRNDKATKFFIKSAGYNKKPFLNYLFAAEVAELQHDSKRADHFLRRAKTYHTKSDLVLDLMMAKLYIKRGAFDSARDILIKKYIQFPRQPQVLYLLSQVFLARHEWDQLLLLFPRLKKLDFFDALALEQLKLTILEGLLQQAMDKQESALWTAWDSMPSAMKKNEQLFLTFVRGLVKFKNVAEAEKQLRHWIEQQWSDEAIALYGTIATTKPELQLAFAEEYLAEFPKNPHLLLTLGQLSERVQVFGKARSYYQEAVQLQPSFTAYLELGKLAEKMKDDVTAQKWYRESLTFIERKSLENNII
jgi:HemY protein